MFAVAFVGFLLMIAASAFAAPDGASPGEIDDASRAAAVADGQRAPPPARAQRGSGAYQPVPRGLVRDIGCWGGCPAISAACTPDPSSDATPVVAATGAGRYHPGYYLAV